MVSCARACHFFLKHRVAAAVAVSPEICPGNDTPEIQQLSNADCGAGQGAIWQRYEPARWEAFPMQTRCVGQGTGFELRRYCCPRADPHCYNGAYR